MRTNHTSDSDCARSFVFVILFVCDREHSLAAHSSHSRGPRQSAADRIAALCVKTGDAKHYAMRHKSYTFVATRKFGGSGIIYYTPATRDTQHNAQWLWQQCSLTLLCNGKNTHTHTYRSTESKSVLFFCVYNCLKSPI